MNLKVLLFAGILIYLSNALSAKGQKVVFFDLLGYPKFIGEVLIANYDRDQYILNFKSTEYKDTLTTAKCMHPIYDSNTQFLPFETIPPTAIYIGDTVFVIIDQQNNVAFFAKKIKKDYQMFSCHAFAGICTFVNGNRGAIEDSSKIQKIAGSLNTYWHPCLLKDSLFEKIVSSYKNGLEFKRRVPNIAQYQNRELQYIFFEDTLRVFHNYEWTPCIENLACLLLEKDGCRSLELLVNCKGMDPAKLKANIPFDMEYFKALLVRNVRWKQ